MRHLLIQLILLSITFLVNQNVGSDQIPAGPQKQPIALTNVTIHPISTETIDNGIIVFSRGQIVAIGKNVSIPGNAHVIDLAGKHVYPGIIEAYSRIGLTEVSAVKATNDYQELGQINPNVRAEVAINPESEYFPVHRANGIAMAVSAPTGGILSGKSALIRMDGWTWEDMTYKAPVSMMMDWPSLSIPYSPSGGKSEEERKNAIEKNMALLNKTFMDVRAYMVAHSSQTNKNTSHYKTDLRLASLIPVLQRELPLWIKANSLVDIEAAISWSKTQQIRIVIIGAADTEFTTELLKENNIPVIVSPILRLPSRRDANFDQPFTLPNKLYQAGVKFCIASGGASAVRNLPYHAAKAAAYGLPKQEALKAITVYAAEILGVSDKLGTLEIGKDATLIITDGDPLEITTHVEKLYIEGRDIDLGNKHNDLYLKYQKRYEQTPN